MSAAERGNRPFLDDCTFPALLGFRIEIRRRNGGQKAGPNREVHRCGDEAAWWQNSGITPVLAARRLSLETHSLASEVINEKDPR